MKLSLILYIGMLSHSLQSPPGCDISKREFKEVSRHFEGSVKLIQLQWPEYPETDTVYHHAGDCLLRVVESGLESGYVVKTRARGRFDYFDYLVIFSPEAKVLGVAVTRYRSDHGAGICQRSWLEQFKGYSGGRLLLGKDIDGVSGGTISASSLVNDMQRCHRLVEPMLDH
jgi:hypothetical protein